MKEKDKAKQCWCRVMMIRMSRSKISIIDPAVRGGTLCLCCTTDSADSSQNNDIICFYLIYDSLLLVTEVASVYVLRNSVFLT